MVEVDGLLRAKHLRGRSKQLPYDERSLESAEMAPHRRCYLVGASGDDAGAA
jgi:hypothetical protein